MPKPVTVRAPATTANLGPGFDIFGLALDSPCDIVMLTPTSASTIKISVTGLLSNTISVLPEKNTAGIVAKAILTQYNIENGLDIKVHKGIMPGKGLGSSAASAAAVAYGLNQLYKLGLDNDELIAFAAKGEVASAGSAHADNVSPAICGNFTIIKNFTPIKVINLTAPENLHLAVATPYITTPASKTKKARMVIPKMVPLKKLVHNTSKVASIAAGFAVGDVDLIGQSMDDAIVEPARASLIPGYQKIRENALAAGACGVAISGAGPSMLAIVNSKKVDAQKVAQALKEGFGSAGCDSTAFATKPGKGVCVV
ncbi:MAG: homoserine kinase [Candidatus Bathyarchaeota archaeon]|nr:homoserine kinase [Candidatus Bathyarchaeota archaeon]